MRNSEEKVTRTNCEGYAFSNFVKQQPFKNFILELFHFLIKRRANGKKGVYLVRINKCEMFNQSGFDFLILVTYCPQLLPILFSSTSPILSITS